MILTCPNCSTRFLLSAFVLAPDGRKVKCSNCSEIWFQLPDPEELRAEFDDAPQEIPDAVKPLPKGSNVPALKPDAEEAGKTGAIGGAIAAALVFLAVSAGVLFAGKDIVRLWPQSHIVFQTLGIAAPLPGEGLVFDRMHASAAPDGKLAISGAVINLGAVTAGVPMMAVDLRDTDGKVLSRVLIEPPQKSIKPEDSMTLSATLDDAPDASEVFIRFALDTGRAAPDAPHQAAAVMDIQPQAAAPVAQDLPVAPQPQDSQLHDAVGVPATLENTFSGGALRDSDHAAPQDQMGEGTREEGAEHGAAAQGGHDGDIDIRIDEAGDGNTPAHPAVDITLPTGHGEALESPPPVSVPPHPESSH